MRSREAAPPERDIFEDDTETADFQLKLRHLNDLNRLVFHIQDRLANIPWKISWKIIGLFLGQFLCENQQPVSVRFSHTGGILCLLPISTLPSSSKNHRQNVFHLTRVTLGPGLGGWGGGSRGYDHPPPTVFSNGFYAEI